MVFRVFPTWLLPSAHTQMDQIPSNNFGRNRWIAKDAVCRMSRFWVDYMVSQPTQPPPSPDVPTPQEIYTGVIKLNPYFWGGGTVRVGVVGWFAIIFWVRKKAQQKMPASVGSKRRKWASVISQNGNSPGKKVTCLSLSILQVGFFTCCKAFSRGERGEHPTYLRYL